MQNDIDTMRRLQADVLALTTDLAAKIAVPATARDGAAIRTDWEQIVPYRPRLNSVYRHLRKFKPGARAALGRIEHDAQQATLRDIKALKRRLSIWDRMADMVARHAEPPEEPINLFPPFSRRDPLMGQLARALHQLANIHNQTKTAHDHGCFADIPLPMHNFEELTRAAYRLLLVQGRTEGARFLDVGCGGGTKVFAATRFFQHSDGLEYDPVYAEAGRQTMRIIAPDCQIMQGDALQFDNYGTYDVIYFYRPLHIEEKLAEMERRILSQCRPGTVILAPYTDALGPREGFPAARITECVFVAGVSQAEADSLHANAIFTDTELVTRASDLPFDTGFWTPLLDAASVNGRHQL